MNKSERLGFGCVALTTYRFKSDAIKMLSLVYENGITKFDTAPLYGKGYSEKILGSFIKNKRDKITLSTKVGLGLSNKESNIPASIALPLYSLKKAIKKSNFHRNVSTELPKPIEYRKIDKEYVEASLMRSLKNLQTDYIDNFFLHEALPSFITESGWEYLITMKQKGVVRNIGIAAGFVNLEHLELSDVSKIDILQYESNYYYNSDELIKKFPSKVHNFHSVLKFISLVKRKQYTLNQVVGFLLNDAVRKNQSNGYVLFSTTNKDRLLSNLKEFENADKFSNIELQKIILSFYE